MATWKSRYSVVCKEDIGSSYVDLTIDWEYNTTSDILKITQTIPEYTDWAGVRPERTFEDLHSNAYALSLLETLIDWAETFEGEGTVEKILKARQEKVNGQ